jgi:hypothetical protein
MRQRTTQRSVRIVEIGGDHTAALQIKPIDLRAVHGSEPAHRPEMGIAGPERIKPIRTTIKVDNDYAAVINIRFHRVSFGSISMIVRCDLRGRHGQRDPMCGLSCARSPMSEFK